MQTLRAFIFGSLLVTMMVAAPICYKRWRDQEFRNFRVVHSGVLYRSGQLSLNRLQKVIEDYDIRTVISLRDGVDAVDKGEENWVKARKLNFVRIPHRDWNPDANGHIPAEDGLKEFRKVMDDPANYPVLVHCYAGIHRTGTTCAIYRIDYQGWSNHQAMNEMRAMGYTILEQHVDVWEYFVKYRSPRAAKQVQAIPVNRAK